MKWPYWHSGLELKAEHLVGLEDYVLTRIALADDTGHGVEQFDWTRCVSISRGDQGVTIRLSGPLSGITPCGMPAQLCENDSLETTIAGGSIGTLLLDISIDVRPASTESRLAARADLVEDPLKSLGPYGNPTRLYLGRYRNHGQNPTELVERPLLRRLSAMKPLDEAWQRWVALFTSPLQALLERLERDRDSGDARTASILPSVALLAFEWPSAYLPHLVRQLQFLSWTHDRLYDPNGARPRTSSEIFPPKEMSGHQVPSHLAQMLPVLVPRRTLPDLLDQLLAKIYLRVPVADFRVWEDHLCNVVDPTLLSGILNSLQQRLNQKDLDIWSQTVGALTIATIGRRISWPNDVLRCYLGKSVTSPEIAACAVLEQLYEGSAQKAPAGPLGFFCLARLVARVSGLASAVPSSLKPYFACQKLQPRATPINLHPPPPVRDRVLGYLLPRKTLYSLWGEPFSSVPRLLGPSVQTADPRKAEKEIQIGVIGARRSGKTTLLREYASIIADRSASTSAIAPLYDVEVQPTGTGQPLFSCTGQLRIGVHTRKLRMFEIASDSIPADADPGGLGPISTMVQNCDLLVFTVDAATVDVDPELESPPLLDVFAAIAQSVRRTNPALVVSIAYTKSDEFGTADPNFLRVVETQGHLAALQAVASAKSTAVQKRWNDFLGSVTTGTDDKWNKTREIVLTQTRELWIALASDNANSALALNGYFVSASPLDDYLKPWSRRGVLQMFGDFYSYL